MILQKNKVAKNAAWLIAGKMAHMALSFLISLLTARYLGPGQFGLINYAAAYATFFAALCNLGINSVIVKHFVDHPEQEGETIGTAMLMRAISSFLSTIMIVGIVMIIDHDEPLTILVVALYCIGIVFQIFDTLNYWFQAKLQSKYYAAATLAAYLIVSGYKILLLIFGMPVTWFAISNAIEYAIVGTILIFVYRRRGGPAFSFSVRKAKELFSDSKSFILVGMMVAIYASTDRMMLKQMLSEEAVGYYALAVSFSGCWTFLLSSVIDSMTPEIMRLHNEDYIRYEKANRLLYAIVFYGAILMSAAVTIAAPWVVRILYGKEYLPAVAPLRVIVWYTAFSYLGVARNSWIVCEKRQSWLKFIYIGAAIMNVVLNLALIPLWGASGAALASLITQFSTVMLLPFMIPSLRANAKLMTQAIALRDLR